MIEARRAAARGDEDQYPILVTLKSGASFRAYVNPPGTRGRKLAEVIVPRNAFSAELFE